ncbi:hypothetical protein ACFYZT_02470 [Streptomyces sp. NPDC001591]|uniref:hypothetical protein n=1 Tax=Streptomyces sp. NPDC001591 TaxID=3364589 RepID=UPI0036AAB2A2
MSSPMSFPPSSSMSSSTSGHPLTDRDERALLAAAEQRISAPLRIGAALAAGVRRLLARRPPVRRAPVRGKARESLPCQQPNTPVRPLPP